MPVTRSPAYPGIPVNQAIDHVGKVYEANRTNPVDREAAAKDMGFRGMTGSSSKALADLAHFGLIERAGKGTIRVTQRAVDILYPSSPAGRSAAVAEAAFYPALFGELRKQFPDGIPSENNLRTHLMRSGFATSAIPFALNSYRETSRVVESAGGSESHGNAQLSVPESVQQQQPMEPKVHESYPDQQSEGARQPLPPSAINKINMNIAEDVVHLSATLDYRGLSLLEKKIANLKALMEPEEAVNEAAQKPN